MSDYYKSTITKSSPVNEIVDALGVEGAMSLLGVSRATLYRRLEKCKKPEEKLPRLKARIDDLEKRIEALEALVAKR